MKGIIFNVVEEVVTELYGADVWDSLLETAGVDGAYTSLGDYDDAEITAIATAAAALLGVSLNDAWRVIGRHMCPRLAARVPDARDQFDDAEEFLLAVNTIIHPEVRLLYPKATPPVFEFSETDDGLLVRYRSSRGMTALAEGLIIGCGDIFGEAVELKTLDDSCSSDCLFLVSFGAKVHD